MIFHGRKLAWIKQINKPIPYSCLLPYHIFYMALTPAQKQKIKEIVKNYERDVNELIKNFKQGVIKASDEIDRVKLKKIKRQIEAS